jgi:Type II CAAX prenyl endopeptidase Rce1-like
MKFANSLLQISKIKVSSQPILLLTLFIWMSVIISQLGSLFYSTSISGQSFQSVVFQSIMYLSMVTLPLSILGILLGRQIELGAPLLSAILRKQSGTLKIFLRDAKLSILPGLFLGGLMLIFRLIAKPYLPQELPSFGFRGVLGGLLVSIGAAIGEEVWFRLGLLTIILWIVTRVFKRTGLQSSVTWTTITIVALLFGAAHLPQLISYGAASTFAVWGTISGNCIVGILYGWCYWRLSLVAAMMAHFSVDLVLHVLPSIFL